MDENLHVVMIKHTGAMCTRMRVNTHVMILTSMLIKLRLARIGGVKNSAHRVASKKKRKYICDDHKISMMEMIMSRDYCW